MRRVTILGVGKLGEAIAEGLLASREVGTLTLVERSEERRQSAARKYRATVTKDAVPACKFADVIILAVKPGDLLELCRLIAPSLKPSQIVLSVAAGVRLERVKEALGGHLNVARIMPNLAVAVRGAVSGVFSQSDEARERGLELFGFLGKAIPLEREEQVDEMTALGASAPAFVAEFLSGLISAGESNGVQEARQIVMQMVSGTVQILEEGNLDEFISRVKTPGGTTAAGLEKLEPLRGLLHEAIQATISRARELDSEVK